jgi:hypothetical protein
MSAVGTKLPLTSDFLTAALEKLLTKIWQNSNFKKLSRDSPPISR